MNEFEVIGKVQGKGRPRFGRGRVYTPQKTVDYEETIRLSFLTSKRILHTSYVGVTIIAMTNNILGKPDIDNIAKVVLDSLNGLAYYDDKQVVKMEITKVHSKKERLIISTYDF